MILLDTDHVTILKYVEHPRCVALNARLAVAAQNQTIGTTVITLEEQMRGWMAEIGRLRDVRKQTGPYEELRSLFQFFGSWTVLPFDSNAANGFERLRTLRIRVGTLDLKIAAIALQQNALLLSANLRDFAKVPRLRVENWLE